MKAEGILPIAQALQVKGVEVLLEGAFDGEGDHRLAVEECFGDEGMAAAADHVTAGSEIVQKAGFGVSFEVEVAVDPAGIEAIDHDLGGNGPEEWQKTGEGGIPLVSYHVIA